MTSKRESNLYIKTLHDAVILKMAYERCEHALASARAILHISNETEEINNLRSKQNLWHILDVVSLELMHMSQLIDSCVMREDKKPQQYLPKEKVTETQPR